LGLLVLAFGALADGAYHAWPAVLAALAGPDGMHAHGLIFGGMLLVLGGVVRRGGIALHGEDVRDADKAPHPWIEPLPVRGARE
jgi:hypothetical protein